MCSHVNFKTWASVAFGAAQDAQVSRDERYKGIPLADPLGSKSWRGQLQEPQAASAVCEMGGESGHVRRSLLFFLLPNPYYEAQLETLTSPFQYSVQNPVKEPDSEAPVTKITALLFGLGIYCHCCNFLPSSHSVFLIFSFLHPYYFIFKMSQISISFFPPQ